MKRQICVVTGSRSEYGLLYWILKGLSQDPSVNLTLAVTGTHLSRHFGLTYKIIEQDGFTINARVPILTAHDSIMGVTKSLGDAVFKFGKILNSLEPDLLVVLGDRYEIFAAVQAALIARIPVAHIGGGDATEGAFDESLRHAITKMSHLHFVTHERAALKIAQLGEDPAHVYNIGYPGLDYLRNGKLLSRDEVEKKLGFKLKARNILVTFHPVTLDLLPSVNQFAVVLKALNSLGRDVGLIFTKPNADPEGLRLARMIDHFVSTHANSRACTSLGNMLYLSVMRSMDVVVGNSSSGIYEAPSLHVPTVNIGDRQKGRLQATSIINCQPKVRDIVKAVAQAYKMDCSKVINPYGDGRSAEYFLNHIQSVQNFKSLLTKRFHMVNQFAPANRVYIIAEAGVNHNGDLAAAKKLVRVAAESGADAVKFQIFNADSLTSKYAEKADYQKRTTKAEESQRSMLERLELNSEAFRSLAALASECKIDFLATPFDEESVDFLVQYLKPRFLKAASGEITNAPLLLKMAQTHIPLIVSTGMSTLKEIEEALGIIAFGYCFSHRQRPGRGAFQKAFHSQEGKKALKEKVMLLHCTTEYPAPFSEVNLRAMDTLRDLFGLKVGLSDHSVGITIPVAASARGAIVIEKHFTLDKNQAGPDHASSVEPEELSKMVQMIRQTEEALGLGRKEPTPSELKNKLIARRSIIASKPIKKGEPFTEDNLTVKRPGNGISPIRYWELLGMHAKQQYQEDEVVQL